MISTDLLIIESEKGWFVVGPNNIRPFSSREMAVGLAEGLIAGLRLSGVESQLYILDRHRGVGRQHACGATAAGDGSPTDAAVYFKQVRFGSADSDPW